MIYRCVNLENCIIHKILWQKKKLNASRFSLDSRPSGAAFLDCWQGKRLASASSQSVISENLKILPQNPIKNSNNFCEYPRLTGMGILLDASRFSLDSRPSGAAFLDCWQGKRQASASSQSVISENLKILPQNPIKNSNNFCEYPRLTGMGI